MTDTADHPSPRPSAGDVFDVLGRQYHQVGVVVADLDRALAAHTGLGPWSVWTYDRGAVPDLACGDEPADFAFRLALTPNDPQLELIQPLDERGPYARWLAEAGPGVHHLGFVVPDVADVTRRMRRAGFEVLLSGSGYGADGGGAFAYFDTVEAVGYVTEAIERPARRREPEAVHP